MKRRDLNQTILALAPAHFDVADHAPSTDAELFAHVAASGHVKVWSGGSAMTIYRDARVNYAFRAWHDTAHFLGRYAFTLAGEIATCELQIRQALRMFPRLPQWIVNAIRSEVIGQAEYFAANGAFPIDQAAFFRHDVGNLI